MAISNDYEKDLTKMLGDIKRSINEFQEITRKFYKRKGFTPNEAQMKNLVAAVKGDIHVQLVKEYLEKRFPDATIEYEKTMKGARTRPDLIIDNKIFVEVKSGGSRDRPRLETHFSELIRKDGGKHSYCLVGFGYLWNEKTKSKKNPTLPEHLENLRRRRVEPFILHCESTKARTEETKSGVSELRKFVEYISRIAER